MLILHIEYRSIYLKNNIIVFGVVLDAQNYQASIWVNHKYVSINPVHNFKLPDASAGLSLTNGMNIFLEKYPNFLGVESWEYTPYIQS